MTTEEMMEFYHNAWNREMENSRKLCMLKDEAIEKMIRLQEQIKEANEIIIPSKSWLNSQYKDCKLLKRNYVVLSSLIRNIGIYCKKWGVK